MKPWISNTLLAAACIALMLGGVWLAALFDGPPDPGMMLLDLSRSK